MSAPHEKLFAGEIQGPSADLRDQLRRAAFSIPLNIADGASEYSPLEKQRVYRISRRSAAECLAILDVLDIISEGRANTTDARRALNEVLVLLVRTSQGVDRLKPEPRRAGPAQAPCSTRSQPSPRIP